MNNLGMIRVAAVSPKLKVANTKYNVDEMLSCAEEAKKQGASVVLFPELAIPGYTCADLFYQEFLYQKNLEGLQTLAASTSSDSTVLIVGFYLRVENNLYNCAAVLQNGKVQGIVPKMFLPNYREFYESRWFASGMPLSASVTSITLFGYDIPFGHLIFTDQEHSVKFGIEICEDLWMPITPGAHLALNGAQIIFNPSASNETVGKPDYRKSLIEQNSASQIVAYVYASAGVCESTTDVVFSGDCLIAENGTLLSRLEPFQRENTITYGEIDYERISFERTYGTNYQQCTTAYSDRDYFQTVALSSLSVLDGKKDCLLRSYPKNPFIPKDPATFTKHCQEIFNIQVSGLAKRIEHSHAKTAVVGISGGLDSTLALLVAAQTFKLLGRDPKDILAITMPGFGTTGKTYHNALTIMELLGTTVKEIPIKEAVLQHFTDIDHNPSLHDVTYENSQARERTQILMDISNQTNGLVVGTGDLSEIALGWSTYNGDHMSMYGVNSGVPKTLIRFVIRWVMDHRLSGKTEDKAFSTDNARLKTTLQDIMDTPISPELLPPDENGEIAQKTEDTVGPYILHDFFLYYTIRFGMSPKKLMFIATQTFQGEYEEAFLQKWLTVFYRRFFSQQFKRSCVPDGPKVGSVSLSPRGDWKMPSDADSELWLKELLSK